MKLRRHSNVREFLDHAEPWLLRHEIEHNLLLGITRQLLSGDHSFEEPVYLATVESAGAVAGCAFRTPPFKLGLTRFPLPAIPLLVRDVGELYKELPAVLGPQAEATAFAELWGRQNGVRIAPGMRQGIHVLESVTLPDPGAPGMLRRAESGDRSLVCEWVKEFVRDTNMPDNDPHRRAEQLVNSGAAYLWETDEARSMAAAAGATPTSMRIGYVYTPPAFRRHGYASALVASLSQLLLDEGYRYCCLYTDLANRTSNAIYRRIGYERKCEVIDIDFVADSAEPGPEGTKK